VAMALFLLPFHGSTGIVALLIQVGGGGFIYGAVLLALDTMNLRKLMRQKLAQQL
jgi:hypothetical protein